MKLWFAIILLLLGTVEQTYAQGYVNQDLVLPILNCQSAANVPARQKVTWHTYQFGDTSLKKDSTALPLLQAHLDTLKGYHPHLRMYIVELANRVTAPNMKAGRTLFIPDYFPEDYRAYSPYPLYYQAADTMPKLFLIDKRTQTFAAYENGFLARWGLVSTGGNDFRTPLGRFNFNWKDKFRLSDAAPPGEVWELNYVFNFQVAQGVHVHQYKLPIDRPASHGCVRMTMADAVWNYYWANQWEIENETVVRNGTPVIVFHHNPENNRAKHWELKDGKIISLVVLPTEFDSLQLGTRWQHVAPWASGH